MLARTLARVSSILAFPSQPPSLGVFAVDPFHKASVVAQPVATRDLRADPSPDLLVSLAPDGKTTDVNSAMALRQCAIRWLHCTVNIVWFVALFLCLRTVGVAAAAAPANDYLSFLRLTPEAGLPTDQVTRIFEDSRGFLWFGTSDGLARYDSHEFRVFRPDPKDPHSLGNGNVTDIQEDAQGNLWIATLGGLDLWHRDTEQFSHFRHDPANAASLSDNGIRSLLLDQDGSLWVGTSNAGLNHFDPRSGKSERFMPEPGRSDSLSAASVVCLFRDRKGQIWIGTGNGGLNRFDPHTGRFQVYAHDPGDPRSLGHNHVSAIDEDAGGYLWVGTDEGISRLDPERRFFERFNANVDDPGALQSRIVDAVRVDREGRVWVGTDGGGLSRFDAATRSFIHYRYSKYDDHTLASDVVRTLFQDRAGDYWIGHHAAVSHADRLAAPFRVFRSLPGETNTLSDEQVMSFLEDPSGDLWVGTDNGGLNHWQPATGRWTSYRHDPHDPRSLGAKAALTLLRDHRGRLWVGTWDGGLDRFEPATATFHHYLPDPARPGSLGNPHVWRLLEDRQHQIWVATSGGGLDCYLPDKDEFIHYRHDPANPRSLNSDYVSSLLLTRNGTLWVGTTEGLARWVPATQSWDRFQNQGGKSGTLSNNDIIDLLEDREGIIWVSTGGGGLNCLDPHTARFESFRTADGLPSDVLRGILEDDDGMLWVASNQGLARFDPHTRRIRIFDENDGLPGGLFCSNARLRLRSGELLFGTTQGFVRFDPRALQKNTNPPPVVLTGFEVFNQPMLPGSPGSPLRQSITETRRLEIPARLSVLSFQFAALNYRSPAHNQYRFMLEGFDKDWRTPGPEQRATYTNLDPGRYLLRVKAADSDGVWNEAGVNMEVIIVPPWWRTWWFRAAAALALLAGAVTMGWAISARRSRTRLREAEHELQAAQELGRAEEAVRESRRRLQVLMGNLQGMAYRCRIAPEWPMQFASEGCLALTGYTPEEITNPGGTEYGNLIHPEDRDAVLRGVQEGAHAGRPFQLEYRITTKDGRLVHVWDHGLLVAGPGREEQWLEGFITDITERKRAEMELQRVNRALRTISACNQVLVRAMEESHLLEDICGVLVGEGGYRMAWVGFAEHDEGQSVRPVVHAGFEDGYLQIARITWADTELGQGPTGTAIRTGKPGAVRFINHDPSLAPWREAALKRGYASSAALPIHVNDHVLGALTVYAQELDAFDSAEMQLLTELSHDLAYGIEALRTRVERRQAEAASQEAENRLADIIEFLPDATFVIDQDKRVIAWNQACEALTGVKKQALLGQGDYAYAEPFLGERRPILIDLVNLYAPEVEATYNHVQRKGGMIFGEIFIPRLNGGQGAYLSGVASPLFDREGRRCGAIETIRDLTEYKRAEEALRQSETTLRSVLKAAPVGICIMKDRVFQSANERWHEIVGYTEAEMLGQTARRLYESEEEYQRVGRELYADLPKQGLISVETRQRRSDGALLDIVLTAARLNPRDASAGNVVAVHDMTERRRVEEARRESERKYRELVQYANSIILRWTRDGQVLFLNEFGQRFFGYTEAEICGRHVIGTIVPETESTGRTLPPMMDEIGADPAAFEQVVNENMRRNGERVWIAWTNKVVLNQQGQVSEILSIGTDITARKQAEEALRARETQLRLIHDNSYDVMFAIGVEPGDHFRFISVNHKFTEVTGLQEEQVVGKAVQEIIPEPACALVLGKYKDAIQSRQPVHWEEVSDYPAGRKIGEVTIAPVFDSAGNCTQLIGTVHDVTERKEAEEDLRRSESKYRTLVETSQDVIWSVDNECRITFMSPAARHVYGYEPEELLGRHLTDLVPPEGLERELQEIERVMVGGASEGYEHVFLRKDGTPVYLSCNSVALHDDHGHVIGAMGVSTDITERKRAEEELRAIQASLERRVTDRTAELAVARDRAEMADRTKSAFLATMSHELRTPLNSIIGFTGLLLQGLAGPLNAEQAKQLGMVKESGQHLLALINDVLDISKIEAGQIEIANAPFDLPESIQKVVQTVTPLANKKRLPLIAQIAPGVGQITSDRRRVEQILLNLLSNAIKFTDRGEVTLTAEITPGTRDNPHPAVRISVADTGMGIKRENLDKLFQPFRQLDTGLTRQHEGTGLGLAICKRLVGRLGGTITVESEWGKGSTFLCTLPIDPERKS
ncbi:MAG: PAS domain S-box protein [Acidobacteriota bacterium]|nr:PAS domain S-box protein [Acidobacteriota bacterium]